MFQFFGLELNSILPSTQQKDAISASAHVKHIVACRRAAKAAKAAKATPQQEPGSASEIFHVSYCPMTSSKPVLRAFGDQEPLDDVAAAETSMSRRAKREMDVIGNVDLWCQQKLKEARKTARRFGYVEDKSIGFVQDGTRSSKSLATTVAWDQSVGLDARYEIASLDIDDIHEQRRKVEEQVKAGILGQSWKEQAKAKFEERASFEAEVSEYGDLMKDKLTRLGSGNVGLDTRDRASAVKDGVRLYYERCQELHAHPQEADNEHKVAHRAEHDPMRLKGSIPRLHKNGNDHGPNWGPQRKGLLGKHGCGTLTASSDM